jgi:hypothetical protein
MILPWAIGDLWFRDHQHQLSVHLPWFLTWREVSSSSPCIPEPIEIDAGYHAPVILAHLLGVLFLAWRTRAVSWLGHMVLMHVDAKNKDPELPLSWRQELWAFEGTMGLPCRPIGSQRDTEQKAPGQ